MIGKPSGSTAYNRNGCIGDQTMSNCRKCKFRTKYDQNPRSILGRIWKWHTSWCPGWKRYLKSLPDETRREIIERYQ